MANFITGLRLVLSPFLLYAFSSSRLSLVVIIWMIAAASDILDGWVARKYHEVTELGKILDPLADKLTIGISLIGLMVWYKLPVWLGLIYLVKEFIQILGGAFIFFKRLKIRASNYWGKIGTALFFAGFFLYLLKPEWGVWVLGAGLFVSVVALFTYARSELKF